MSLWNDGWYPHSTGAGGAGSVRWTDDDPRWSEWAELHAGRERVAAIRAWAATEWNSDRASVWVDRWGTTEPDRTTIRRDELPAPIPTAFT